MKRIVKVIYQDGSELEPKNISPLEISEDRQQQWRNQNRYNRQFRPFEEDILDALDEDVVEDYAKDHFDLIDESEIEDEKDISDFSDAELMEEVAYRKLLGSNNSIISAQFITRFSKIIDKENQILLDNILTKLEARLNII